MSLTVSQLAAQSYTAGLVTRASNSNSSYAVPTQENPTPDWMEKIQRLDQQRRAAVDAYRKGDLSQLADQALSGGDVKKTEYTPETANEAAAQGIPTHGFFYQNIDELAQIANDPEQTLSDSFAVDTLDFFTGGNYSQEDVSLLQSQMQTALQEMAGQLEETGSVDAGKLKSRMTIGGAEVSLGQLAGFQMMGQQLSSVFDGIQESNTRFEDMQASAKMAVARRMGQAYGQDKGQIGTMFSDAIDRLYQKGMDKVNLYYTDDPDGVAGGSAYADSASQLKDQVASMFGNLDTSNKSALGHDFSDKLSLMQSMINQQNEQFGIPAGYRNAASAAKNIGLFFSAAYQML